jgi:hypothetical protein
VGGEGVLEIVFGGVEGKISDKQFIIHFDDVLIFRIAPGFRECSRPSGLESSLNCVHLRICHALKVMSYLTKAYHPPFYPL